MDPTVILNELEKESSLIRPRIVIFSIILIVLIFGIVIWIGSSNSKNPALLNSSNSTNSNNQLTSFGNPQKTSPPSNSSNVAGVSTQKPNPTPTPSPKPKPSTTPTPTPSPSSSPTPTPEPTATSAPEPTPTPSSTPSPAPTESPSATSSATPNPT